MAWYDGDPSVNLAISERLDALDITEIGPIEIDPETAAYTLVAADAGKLVTVTDASASALTVPPNSAVAFPIGTKVEVAQLGAGLVTITAGAGVTVHSSQATLKMAQWALVSLLKVAVNTWLASGELAAS